MNLIVFKKLVKLSITKNGRKLWRKKWTPYWKKTWELVKLPKGRRALQNKWVYIIKHEGEGEKKRYKERLVVKGFSQKEGIDFNEIFSLVVKMPSIRVILGLVATLDLECE